MHLFLAACVALVAVHGARAETCGRDPVSCITLDENLERIPAEERVTDACTNFPNRMFSCPNFCQEPTCDRVCNNTASVNAIEYDESVDQDWKLDYNMHSDFHCPTQARKEAFFALLDENSVDCQAMIEACPQACFYRFTNGALPAMCELSCLRYVAPNPSLSNCFETECTPVNPNSGASCVVPFEFKLASGEPKWYTTCPSLAQVPLPRDVLVRDGISDAATTRWCPSEYNYEAQDPLTPETAASFVECDCTVKSTQTTVVPGYEDCLDVDAVTTMQGSTATITLGPGEHKLCSPISIPEDVDLLVVKSQDEADKATLRCDDNFAYMHVTDCNGPSVFSIYNNNRLQVDFVDFSNCPRIVQVDLNKLNPLIGISNIQFTNSTISNNTNIASAYDHFVTLNHDDFEQCLRERRADGRNPDLYGGAVLYAFSSAGKSPRPSGFENTGALATIKFINSEIANNAANTRNAGQGGAFLFDSVYRVSMELENCHIHHNEASSSGGVIYVSTSDAFFHANSFTQVAIKHSTIENNFANQFGGVIVLDRQDIHLEIEDSTFVNNTAAMSGGVGYLTTGSMRCKIDMVGSTFETNHANVQGGVWKIEGQQIDRFNFEEIIAGNDGVSYNNSATCRGSTFVGNTADDHGGVISLDVGTTALEISESEFRDNRAAQTGGVLSIVGQNDFLVSQLQLDQVKYRMASSVHVTDSLFQGNEATDGGAVWFTRILPPTVAFANSRFLDNIAIDQGGAFASSSNAYMHDGNETVSLVGCTFSGNTAMRGGGWYLQDTMSILASGDTKFEANTADEGAAIFLVGQARASLVDTTISLNKPKTKGTVMVTDSATLQVERAVIDSNGPETVGNEGSVDATSSFGGFAYVAMEGTLSVKNAEATGNRASFGGFLYAAEKDSRVTLSQLSLTGNSALYAGGAMVFTSSMFMEMDDIEFLLNVAGDTQNGYGGAVYVLSPTEQELAARLLQNTCPVEDAKVVLNNVRFIENQAFTGAAVHVENPSLVGLQASDSGTCLPENAGQDDGCKQDVIAVTDAHCVDNTPVKAFSGVCSFLDGDVNSGAFASSPSRIAIYAITERSGNYTEVNRLTVQPSRSLPPISPVVLNSLGQCATTRLNPQSGGTSLILQLDIPDNVQPQLLVQDQNQDTYPFESDALVLINGLKLLGWPGTTVDLQVQPLKDTAWYTDEDVRTRMTTTLSLQVDGCDAYTDVLVTDCSIFSLFGANLVKRCEDEVDSSNTFKYTSTRQYPKCVRSQFMCSEDHYIPTATWDRVFRGDVVINATALQVLEQLVTDAPDGEICTPCEVGTFRQSSQPVQACVGQSCKYPYEYLNDGVCSPCEAGYFCSGYRRYECGLGKYCPELSTAPIDCPVDTYNQLTTTGTSLDDACKRCPTYEYQQPEGEMNRINRTTMSQTGVADPELCLPCRTGQHCWYENLEGPLSVASKDHTFLVSDGHNETVQSYLDNPSKITPEVRQCYAINGNGDTACLDQRNQTQTCADAYVGQLCLACVEGHVRTGSYGCKACYDSGLVVALFILATLALVFWISTMIFFSLRRAGKESNFIVTRMLTAHVQLLSTFSLLPFNWRDTIAEGMFNMGEAVPGAHAIGVQCFFDTMGNGDNFFAKYALMYIILVALLILGIALYWGLKYLLVFRHEDRLDKPYATADAQSKSDNMVESADNLGNIDTTNTENLASVVITAVDENGSTMNKSAESMNMNGSGISTTSSSLSGESSTANQTTTTFGSQEKGLASNQRTASGWMNRKSKPMKRFFMCVFVVFQVMHLQLLRIGLEFFSFVSVDASAERNPISPVVMRSNPSIDVNSSTYYGWAFGLGLPMIIVFGLGIPGFTFYLLVVRLHSKRKRKQYIRDFGNIYSAFREPVYYWEVVIMVRLAMFAFATVLLQAYPSIQIASVLLLVVCSLSLSLWFDPYQNPTYNKLEFMSYFVAFLSLYGGMFLYPEQVVYENSRTVTTVATVFVWVPNILFFGVCMYTQCMILRKRWDVDGHKYTRWWNRHVLRRKSKTPPPSDAGAKVENPTNRLNESVQEGSKGNLQTLTSDQVELMVNGDMPDRMDSDDRAPLDVTLSADRAHSEEVVQEASVMLA